MGLFSSQVAEVKVDFYGQKRRNKVVSNIQVYYQVSVNGPSSDVNNLAMLYSKCFIACSNIAVLPADRELFWKYVNASFKNIGLGSESLFDIWPGFVDVAPILSYPGGKVNTSVKLRLMDNGKVKYNISENAVTVYYNPLTVVGLMQYFKSTLTPEQFNQFYEGVRYELNKYKLNDTKTALLAFNLEELLPIESEQPHQQAQRTQQTTSQVQQPSSNRVQEETSYETRYCSACGAPLSKKGDVAPKFCHSCGQKL